MDRRFNLSPLFMFDIASTVSLLKVRTVLDNPFVYSFWVHAEMTLVFWFFLRTFTPLHLVVAPREMLAQVSLLCRHHPSSTWLCLRRALRKNNLVSASLTEAHPLVLEDSSLTVHKHTSRVFQDGVCGGGSFVGTCVPKNNPSPIPPDFGLL